ncbi:MFS transporter [Egibacter rhizosphaerae]|uniref:MFS transporter n=1 Tax=Egibacter rhizosphaerae TaxID=1670831 RepID=A0A411YBP2_9ACTN|nr:MFS transporter [Egibacter rhizosphaerae]QBI18673.1 MFS transporter [Egibacter rhizosphaerae]
MRRQARERAEPRVGSRPGRIPEELVLERPRAVLAAVRGFYGWRIVLFAALGLAFTAPGQTVGNSVFIDHFIADLDLTRSQVSGAYLVGTLVGGATMPFVGRWIDRFGVRLVMAFVGAGFALALVGMSAVVGFVSLLIGFTGIRMLGQGALGLVSTTSVSYWFERRRGAALGITVAIGSALMSLAPLALTRVIDVTGWRSAWIVAGVLVGVVVVSTALLGMRDRPEHVGQGMDGDVVDPQTPPSAKTGWARGEAMRTSMFWAVTGAVAAVGLIGTGLQFHQISLLGEQGLTPVEAAANFIPVTIATIAATLLVGALIDRVRPRHLIIACMVLLLGAMLAVPFVSPGVLAVVYALALGTAGGGVRSLEAAVFPRFFGLAHVGAIRGSVMALNVGSTAFGPLALAAGFDLTGSYVPAIGVLAVLPAAVIVAALFAPVPDDALLERIRQRRPTAGSEGAPAESVSQRPD